MGINITNLYLRDNTNTWVPLTQWQDPNSGNKTLGNLLTEGSKLNFGLQTEGQNKRLYFTEKDGSSKKLELVTTADNILLKYGDQTISTISNTPTTYSLG